MDNVNTLVDLDECKELPSELKGTIVACISDYLNKLQAIKEVTPDFYNMMLNPSSIKFYRERDAAYVLRLIEARSTVGRVIESSRLNKVYVHWQINKNKDVYFICKSCDALKWRGKSIAVYFSTPEQIDEYLEKQANAQVYPIIGYIGKKKIVISFSQKQDGGIILRLPIV